MSVKNRTAIFDQSRDDGDQQKWGSDDQDKERDHDFNDASEEMQGLIIVTGHDGGGMLIGDQR